MMKCEYVTATQLHVIYSKCAYQLMCTVEPYASDTPIKYGHFFCCPNYLHLN